MVLFKISKKKSCYMNLVLLRLNAFHLFSLYGSMKIPFRISPKLGDKPLFKYPKHIRTLLKVGQFSPNNGPRTIESVVSYINRDVRNSNEIGKSNNSLNDIRPKNLSNIKIIMCISAKDFPLGLHRRLLVLLIMRGILTENIHWVITDYDLCINGLDSQLVLHSDILPIKQNIIQQLNTYMNGFFDSIESITDDEIKSNSVLDKLNKFKISPDRLHLFSASTEWTLDDLMSNLGIDMDNLKHSYIIGQTNTGKTTLTREILKCVQNDLMSNQSWQNFTKVSDFTKIKPSPIPFMSSFQTYQFPGMTLTDTPGIARHNGGIWGHVNQFGARFLRTLNPKDDEKIIKELNNNPDVKIKANVFPKSEENYHKGISIGDLIYLKPWTNNPDNDLNVKILKNFQGKVSVIDYAEINKRLYDKESVKIFKDHSKERYLIHGYNNMELVLDNIGTVKIDCSNDNSNVYWEVIIPKRVRMIQRFAKDGETLFKTYKPLCTKIKPELYRLSAV